MGWLATIASNLPLGLGAYGLARDAFRQPAGLPRALAAGVVAWAWMTLGMIGLGLAGGLRAGPIAAWALGLAGLAAVARARRRAPVVEAPAGSTRWDAPATAALGLVIWMAVAIGAGAVVLPVKVVSDGPIYHLYFAARWWQAGRLEMVPVPFGEGAAAYFPAGGDLWFAWLMIGQGGDRLARVGQAPFLLMAAAAAYGMARRLGAGGSAALVASAWFVGCLPMILFAFEANVDAIFIAGYLASAFFLLRFALGDGDREALILGGLAAGLAWGTKPTALVFVPVLVALGAWAIARRGGARTGRMAILVGSTALPVAHWYGRNAWVGEGNPLYPLQVTIGGRAILRGWYESSAMASSQYYMPIGAIGALAETLLSVLDPRLAAVWLLAIGGAWGIGLGRRRADAGWVWLASALAALNVATYWVLIPYRTQQRFMLQGVGLAVVPLAALLDRGRAIRWLAVVLLALHATTPPNWLVEGTAAGSILDLSRLIPAINAAPVPLPTTRAELARIASAGGIEGAARRGRLVQTIAEGVGSMAVAWLWARATTRRRVGLAIGASAALVGVSVLAVVAAIGSSSVRFPSFAPYYRAWVDLDARTARDGARVAYAGTDIPYYLMGPEFRNDVRYVNVDGHRDWLLHDYARAARGGPTVPWPTPRPGWDRLRPDYDAWLANLRAARIRVLVVAAANPAEGPFNLADAQGFPIERVWADAHPDVFAPIYGVDPPDPQMKTYAVRPPAHRPPESATDSGAGSH